MGPGQGPAFDPRFGDHASQWWEPIGRLLPWLAFAILIGLAIWGLLHLARTGALAAPTPVGSTMPVRPDGALEELRLRYARGEMDRGEFLRRNADLGGSTIPGEPVATSEPQPPPGGPEPPPAA